MTAIICIALFLGGFAFPPLWLGLIGYIIYLWKTGKQRRSDIIQSHLKKMIDARQTKANVRNLYFEAARAFAEDHGGRIFPEDQDIISCTVGIGGKPHRVSFMRERNSGGTYIQIFDYIPFDLGSPENFGLAGKAAQNAKSRYDVAMENAMRQLTEGTVSTPSWATDSAASKFLLSECINAAIKAGLDAKELSDESVGEAFTAIACTGAYHFEKQGFPRSEQIAGAADLSASYAKAHNRNGWSRFFNQNGPEKKISEPDFNENPPLNSDNQAYQKENIKPKSPANYEENPFIEGIISPLLIMQSAKIIYKSDKLNNMTKDWFGGSVIEVMVSIPTEESFFIYYENEDYYYEMANGIQSISLNINGDDYRNNASIALCRFLIAYIYENYGKDIRHPQMQFSHNRIHTNVIAYVERLGEWYPIQHNSSEDDDATERKVSRINNRQSDVRDFVAIDRLSPS